MPSNWFLFDRIRALTRKNNIFQSERIFQDQPQLDKMMLGDNFVDLNNAQSSILDQTTIQINRMARYMDYELMDQTGIISLALDLYADEASLVDPERKHTLIIRARNRRLKRALESFCFDTLQWDTQCRPAIRYLCKYGDCPFEIVTNVNRTAVSSVRFMSAYNFTRVETKFGDLVGFFYQDPMTPAPVFLHPWQVIHMRLTSFENIYAPYGRCCSLQSFVDTPTGHKRLKDVKPGDIVMSWDGQKAVPDKVIAVASNGVKSTLKIRTKHRELHLTPEHPVLAVIKDNYIDTKFGRKRDITTRKWVLVKDLKIGDKVVLPKYHNCRCDIPLNANKHVTNNSHAGHRLVFPEFVDRDFAKLMGFLIGDGWTSTDGNSTCFAQGEHQDINNKYISIIQSYGYNREPGLVENDNSEYGYYQFSSIELTQTVTQMGLHGRCFEKRAPEWIFSATDDIKLAFIEGIVDSDGSINIDEWDCERCQLESTSEGLVYDIKCLLDRMNYKCGNVSKRNKRRSMALIHGKSYPRRNSWILYWYYSKMPSGDIKHRGNKITQYCYNSDDYLLESIIRIEDGGKIEVGDIQMQTHANFIVGGVVVHNSIIDAGRRSFKQLRLMEDAALVYRITRAPEKRKFKIPVGDISPKEVPGYMNMIARMFKRQRFYNPTTNTFDERYSPLIQEDDFFLPFRTDGQGPDIEILAGGKNLGEIEDIEYFKKNMVAPLKIPFSRVGLGEGAGEANEKSLSQSSSEFSKAVQWVQREAAKGITKAAIVHLALQGYGVEDLKGFEIALTATSAMEDLYRMETWNTRINVMTGLKDLGWFPKEWITTHFTDLSPDEIEELKDAESEANGGMAGLGGGGGGLDNLGGQLGGDDVMPGEDDDLLAPQLDGVDGQAMEGSNHFDADNVIKELDDKATKDKRRMIIESMFTKMGKSIEKDDYINEFYSGYDGVLVSKELDGLTGNPTPADFAGKVHDPRSYGKVMIEWTTSGAEAEEAVNDTMSAMGFRENKSVVTGPLPQGINDSEVILEDDLPNPGIVLEPDAD